MTLFKSRKEAGKELSENLKDQLDIDTVIIPYPEAADIGFELAKTQNADVHIHLSEFISAPNVPHANIGAVTEDGTLWIEDSLKNELKVSNGYIENTSRIKSNNLSEKSINLQKRSHDLRGKDIAIVSDGINSGFREAAVAGNVLKKGAENTYIVTPITSRNIMADLRSVSKGLFYLHEVPFLSSPDSCYVNNPDIEHRKSYTA